jgi:hypothetical protein
MPAIRALAVLSCALATFSMLAAAPTPSQTKPLVSPQAGPQTMCPEVEMPVCGTKNGTRVRYGNHCKAARDGATDIRPGACPAGQTIVPNAPRPR